MSKLSLSVQPKIKTRKITRIGLVRKLDKLFSEQVRAKGFCERCGKKENLQCAHVYSRRHKCIRWDFENAICLCAGDHNYWWHMEPAQAIKWAMTFKDFDYLEKKLREAKPLKMQDLFEIEQKLLNIKNK